MLPLSNGLSKTPQGEIPPSSSKYSKYSIDSLSVDSRIKALKKIASLEEGQEFYTKIVSGKLKIVSLKSNAGILENLTYKLSKWMCEEFRASIAIFDLTYDDLSAESKECYNRAVENIKMKVFSNTNFYQNKKDIKHNLHWRHCIRISENKAHLSDWMNTNVLKYTLIDIQEKIKNKPLHGLLSDYAGMALGDVLHTVVETPHFYNVGGTPITSTLHEVNAVKKVLADEVLEEKDKLELQTYLEAAENSLDINYLIYEEKTTNNPKILQLAALTANQRISELTDGKSVFLDVGYAQHSMRLVVTKVPESPTLHFTLFDTGGALEFMEGNWLKGISSFLTGKKQCVALQIEVAIEKFNRYGTEYLEQLLSFETQTFSDPMESRNVIDNYMGFQRVFKSLPGSRVLKSEQHPQESQNCYDKRLEAAQYEHMNPTNFLRVRQKHLELASQKLLTTVFALSSSGKDLIDMSKDLESLTKYVNNLSKEEKDFSQVEVKNLKEALQKMEKIPQNIDEWKIIFQYIQARISQIQKMLASQETS